jgi:hypothetical protein
MGYEIFETKSAKNVKKSIKNIVKSRFFRVFLEQKEPFYAFFMTDFDQKLRFSGHFDTKKRSF